MAGRITFCGSDLMMCASDAPSRDAELATTALPEGLMGRDVQGGVSQLSLSAAVEHRNGA
eukprot:scaffold1202_cov228-Pinguiococcus_pyrenoidosus.AAC.2